MSSNFLFPLIPSPPHRKYSVLYHLFFKTCYELQKSSFQKELPLYFLCVLSPVLHCNLSFTTATSLKSFCEIPHFDINQFWLLTNLDILAPFDTESHFPLRNIPLVWLPLYIHFNFPSNLSEVNVGYFLDILLFLLRELVQAISTRPIFQHACTAGLDLILATRTLN